LPPHAKRLLSPSSGTRLFGTADNMAIPDRSANRNQVSAIDRLWPRTIVGA
jgi:hypothetical protein